MKLCGLTLGAVLAAAAAAAGPAPPLDASLRNEGAVARSRGQAFLRDQQAQDGGWAGDPVATVFGYMALTEDADATHRDQAVSYLGTWLQRRGDQALLPFVLAGMLVAAVEDDAGELATALAERLRPIPGEWLARPAGSIWDCWLIAAALSVDQADIDDWQAGVAAIERQATAANEVRGLLRFAAIRSFLPSPHRPALPEGLARLDLPDARLPEAGLTGFLLANLERRQSSDVWEWRRQIIGQLLSAQRAAGQWDDCGELPDAIKPSEALATALALITLNVILE